MHFLAMILLDIIVFSELAKWMKTLFSQTSKSVRLKDVNRFRSELDPAGTGKFEFADLLELASKEMKIIEKKKEQVNKYGLRTRDISSKTVTKSVKTVKTVFQPSLPSKDHMALVFYGLRPRDIASKNVETVKTVTATNPSKSVVKNKKVCKK